MKQFCYVIVNNAGHSWAVHVNSDGAPRSDGAPLLPLLLQEGWEPVRETPMGGGTSHMAHSLVILQREAPKPTKPTRGKASQAASA
jgi:hypothetical protein